MAYHKVWVKRPGASATLVQVAEDDLVDDMRDMILRKYANSLGRNFDSPDVTLHITERRHGGERLLGPEEPICKTLERAFPGGQTVNEALVIDTPQRRTPRPSPRVVMNPTYGYEEHQRPPETGSDYFPPMPLGSPHSTQQPLVQEPRTSYHHPVNHAPHAMSILSTGQLPPLPSPRQGKPHHRPRTSRQHTASPTLLGAAGTAASYSSLPHQARPRPRHDSSSDLRPSAHAPAAPPLPTPPAPEAASNTIGPKHASTPPVDRVTSPRPGVNGNKVKKLRNTEDSSLQQAHEVEPSLRLPLLNMGSVPPINVLIVEDNIINLKLLEAFVKRLKVRWASAMNGREAVNKWRQGGFHLVLMDIQLPIMSGLAATKEIRRLERVNGIGVFAKSAGENHAPVLPEYNGLNGKVNGVSREHQEAKEDDKLPVQGLFKSPVIIVALTASSLQSDRHEALAAGCNDFLTKVHSQTFPIH